MFNKKEIPIILVIMVILTLTISLIKSIEFFLYTLLAVFLVVIINLVAKKIICYYVDSEIEIKLWEIKRYGFKPKSYLKKPLPIGGILPFLITALTLGFTTWMACLVFEVTPKVYRAAKRHGLYRFSAMTESHIGLIAAAGIIANLVFAVIGYLLGFPEFAKISIFYAFFNMIPISNLDGNKIFFGSLVFWSFLAAIVLIGLAYVFLVV